MTRSSKPLLLPVFGGQGTLAHDSENVRKQLLRGAASSSGAVLLDACHAALHAELISLSSEILKKVDICASDFKDKVALLCPRHERHFSNPAVAGPTLLLTQILRYLSYVEDAPEYTGSSTRFVDMLQGNIGHEIGVLGFSSGILSACVVAASRTALSFISHAVEAYRLSFWIGIRCQLYRNDILESSKCQSDPRPWALVILGISKSNAQRAIIDFNKRFDIDRVHMTAVMDEGCVTISGHPDDLASFVPTLPGGAITHEMNINALYHCPSQLQAVRDNVLGDVLSREIKFPAISHLFTPIRSTSSGDVIWNVNPSGSLVELVIDMVLTQPVNWDVLVEKVARDLPREAEVHLVNIGLGKSLARGLEHALSLRNIGGIVHVDLRNEETSPRCKAKQDPIAVIGMAVNMPSARTAGELWNILSDGINTVEDIPTKRFEFADYTEGHIAGRVMKTHTGNFINGVDEFDHKFFNISPREAKSMDPQQRILLHVAYEALEDAGYVSNASPTFEPETFGCFIGASTHDYMHNLRNDIDVYYTTGTLTAFLSGRLSYCLGLSGPSVVVDTACSSSMVAIYQAARALMNGDCNAALAGGINIISSPDMFIGLDRGHFLSPSGQCKSFDAAADGYSRAEGCGVFVLKRLSDAIAENDQILGIIRGVEVNQSGQASSITHPHVPTQEALFKQVLRCSDIDANSVNVVEAHGTGTQAGDTNEMESIRRVLAFDRSSNNPLYVTSIKANIGHLEAASGCASLAKVLLMFRQKVIPRQISLQTLNPRIAPLAPDNIIIPTTNLTWPPAKKGRPRIALINNFGAAGSNATLLVEEFIPPNSNQPASAGPSYIFGLSAKDTSSLEALRAKYVAWLEDPQEVSLLDLAYTMTARRQLYPCRLIVSASSKHELIGRLNHAPLMDVQQEPSPVVFVFSGQGGRYRGMGRSLYLSSSTFKYHIDQCDSILTSSGFGAIISIIIGGTEDQPPALGDTEEYQSAMFSLQYALAKLWMSWGIRPVAVVGHSLGEYAALVTAGVLTLRDALIIVATRARRMIEKCTIKATSMVAVQLGPVKTQAILDSTEEFANLSISCFNSPKDCTVSGPIAELQALKDHLEKVLLCRCTQLSVPYGYHSPAMFPVLDDLLAIAKKIRTRPPLIPVISTVLGRVVMPGDLAFCRQDYFARHCVEPVRFVEGIESYLSDPILAGNTTWLEIGPHPAVLPMLKAFPGLSNAHLLGSLRKWDGWSLMAKTLSSFYLTSQSIDWRNVFAQLGPTTCLSLPSYPFSTRSFWVPFKEDSVGRRIEFSLIRNWVQFPSSGNDDVAILETTIEQLKAYIQGHRVGGIPLCPASVYLELVFAAVTMSLSHLIDYPEGFNIALHRTSFPKPLTWKFADEKGTAILRIVIDTKNETFIITSGGPSCYDEATHAEGEYQTCGAAGTESTFGRLFPSILRRVGAILSPENGQTPETFSTRTAYQVIFPRVVEYSKNFHTVQSLAMQSNGMEAAATMKLDIGSDSGRFVVHPIFLDTLIHVAGFISNLHGGLNHAYICNEIGSFVTLPARIDKNASYTIYCKISELSDQNGMLGESYAILDSQPRMLVAHVEGIRFQRVRLSGLKTGLASIAGLSPPSSLGRTTEDDRLPNRLLASDNESVVLGIIAKACNINFKDISIHQDLDSLGIDSLMRLELCYDLSKAFPGFGFRSEEISSCKNIVGIVNMISSNPSFEEVYSPGYSSVASTPRTLVSNSSPLVKRVFAQVLDLEEDAIKDDADLASLGLDSLTSIEASHIFSNRFHINMPINFLSPRRTIRDIESQLLPTDGTCFPFPLPETSMSDEASKTPMHRMKEALGLNMRLWPLQTADSQRTPLVLIHDGSGLAVSYQRISNLGRSVWAINNPNFCSSRRWVTITQMAESYAMFILERITGPIILGGWSFGGVVAFEVAKLLQARSVAIQGVILIDSPNPFIHISLPLFIIDLVLATSKNVDPEVRTLCKAQFTMNAQLLSKYDPYETRNYGSPSRLIFLRSMEGYNPSNHNDIPSWLSDRSDAASITHGWELLAGAPVKIFDIPGHHFQPFEPQNVEAVSRSICNACELLDS